jgi:hypothetical protein
MRADGMARNIDYALTIVTGRAVVAIRRTSRSVAGDPSKVVVRRTRSERTPKAASGAT